MAKKLLVNLIILASTLVSSGILVPQAKADEINVRPVITYDPINNQVGAIIVIGGGNNQKNHRDRDCDHPRHREKRQYRQRGEYRQSTYTTYSQGSYSDNDYQRQQQLRQRDLDRVAYERQQREEQIRQDEARRRDEYYRRQQNGYGRDYPVYNTSGSYHHH